MLEILESQKHVVALRLSDKLTAEDVSAAYKATSEAIKATDRISVFVEVEPSMQLTFEGLAKDVVEGISRLGNLKHYYRLALVTDKGWIAALARVEGLMLSTIDVRVFELSERDKAFAGRRQTPIGDRTHENSSFAPGR